MSSISVYLPTRDRAELLTRALDSVLAQSCPPLEILVVDDGSSDETPRLLAQLAREHGALRVLRNEVAQGAPAARNRAIREARGRFVTGLDDDDALQPGHLAGLLRAYSPRYAFVCSSRLEVHREGAVPNRLDAGEITLDALLHYNKVGNQVFAERERVLEAGGFDEALPAFQDYDLWVRLVAGFGPCLKTRDASYVVHLEHGAARLSDSPQRVLAGLEAFEARHRARMGRSHRASMELLRRRIRGEPLRLRELPRLARPGNWKAALGAWADGALPAAWRLQRRLRRLAG